MSASAAELISEQPFLHRLLAALANPSDWQTRTDLVVQAWIGPGGASAAILLSPTSPDQLQLVWCRNGETATAQSGSSLLDAPFSTLLDPSIILGMIAELGLIGGLHVRVLSWVDIAAVLVIQLPDEASINSLEPVHRSLETVSRQLLSSATGRPAMLPNPFLLEAMAEYAAGAGHEINNPLASIIGQAQMLLKGQISTEQRQAFETIGAQAWRIRDMIGNSMLFARPPLPQRKQFNLVEITRQVLQPLTELALRHQIEIKLASTSDEILMDADQTQLSTLIGHLVRNSVEAIKLTNTPGRITVTLRDDQPGAVELSVIDSGPGITSPVTRQHLFNPFYSGRSAGRGSGFGLCLAWQITRLHGGMILHESPAAGGAAFHVAIPTKGP